MKNEMLEKWIMDYKFEFLRKNLIYHNNQMLEMEEWTKGVIDGLDIVLDLIHKEESKK
jgi:hypothetical protein